MRTSIDGVQKLPESGGEFTKLEFDGKLRFRKCLSCDSRFCGYNTQTPEGWAETQISGLCEMCFDEATESGED